MTTPDPVPHYLYLLFCKRLSVRLGGMAEASALIASFGEQFQIFQKEKAVGLHDLLSSHCLQIPCLSHKEKRNPFEFSLNRFSKRHPPHRVEVIHCLIGRQPLPPLLLSHTQSVMRGCMSGVVSHYLHSATSP